MIGNTLANFPPRIIIGIKLKGKMTKLALNFQNKLKVSLTMRLSVKEFIFRIKNFSQNVACHGIIWNCFTMIEDISKKIPRDLR